MRRAEMVETVARAVLALDAADELAEAVREYESEVENPAPDYTMRRVRRGQMVAAAAAYRAARAR